MFGPKLWSTSAKEAKEMEDTKKALQLGQSPGIRSLILDLSLGIGMLTKPLQISDIHSCYVVAASRQAVQELFDEEKTSTTGSGARLEARLARGEPWSLFKFRTWRRRMARSPRPAQNESRIRI